MRAGFLAVLALVGLHGCTGGAADESDPVAHGGTTEAHGDEKDGPDGSAATPDEYSGVAKPVTPAPPPTTPPPTTSADGGTPPPVSACPTNTLYCGGTKTAGDKSTVYRCAADGITGAVVSKCANGCVSGKCNAPTKCVVGGVYCGGDKVNGDPSVLYKCTGTGLTATVQTKCANSCTVAPAGKDDACK